MSSLPSPNMEVEEGSPFGGDTCEDDSPVNDDSVGNNETEQTEGNLFPFANLSVEFYEEPEEDGDSSNTRISGHQDTEEDTTTDLQEPLEKPIISCENTQDSSATLEDMYSDNSKSNIAESENQDTDEQALDLDASESYESNALLRDELNDTDYKELQKTCIENFMYPSALANFDETSETSNSALDDTKGSPLSRFPKIVKAVGSADYEILQILYQLLYQRKAWDTQEILIQRILEFSGFTFSQNSEDYFNSEMMLRTLPDNVLLKIGDILYSDHMKNIPKDFGKVRPDLISNIMEFLSKPKKRTRVLKLGEDANTSPAATPSSASKCGCRNRCLKKFTLKEQDRMLKYMEIIKERKLLDSYILSMLAIRKICRKNTSEEAKKLREISYQYKVKVASKEALVCKGAFCILHGFKIGKVTQLQNKLKSGKNLPVEMKSEDFPNIDIEVPVEATPKKVTYEKRLISPRKSPVSAGSSQKVSSDAKQPSPKLNESKLDKIQLSLKKVPKVVVEKIDLNTLNTSKDTKTKEKNSPTKVTKAPDDTGTLESPQKSKETPKENKSSTCEKTSEGPKKLKDFALVVKSIENAPEELLIDVHFLLFLTSADVDKIKDNILNFSGFSFDSETEEYDERNEFLQRMSNKILTDVARSFSLAVLNKKEDTIKNVLSFLTKPDESYLRTYGSVPVILSDDELDDIDMSDSDESITCEVVEKKVECIDLISSGEESDKEDKAKKKNTAPQVTNLPQKPVIEQKQVAPEPPPLPPPPVVQEADNSQTATESSETSETNEKRTLRNFETICKIVNTHPHEYLVDIYDLLYMKKHDPNTLRSDILDFSGFAFEKGSAEYIKRKQLLDRMLYNSVRRIYNTLIHNTTEIKVFSKPTMITEIFQFLFKLPDHDTSIRPPPTTRPVAKPLYNKNAPAKASSPLNASSASGPPLPNQSGKLSDLKRVFQRVACFPCEYLIDVHKLLFMTDCDPKVIRQNIFGFKGFSFGIDSPEFQQRKMYLEYLTFHSLRKISSVLTTRSVDLRNSTKHELATHLTQVLAEYTNTYIETEAPVVTEANSQPGQNTVANTSTASDSNVENIVVTPIIDTIETMQTSPTSTSSDNQIPVTSAPVTAASNASDVSSTSVAKPSSNKTAENSPALAISIVDTRSISQLPVTSTSGSRSRRKRKSPAVRIAPDKKTASQPDNSQFADINLPEIEQYRQIYGQNLNLYAPAMPAITGLASFNGSNVVPQTFPHLVPQTLSFPVVHTYPQPLQVQSPFQPVQQTSQVLGIQTTLAPGAVITQVPNKPSEVIVPGDCINDGSTEEPAAKKSKSINSPGDKDEAISLQSKLRDVMNANDDDEEDCDKPLASLIGHPIDSVLRKQICDIVEQTDLQDITINGVIQKIYNMYPKFDLSYRKEFIKSTLRSILYKLGEKKSSEQIESREANSPDCSVSTTDIRDSPVPDSAAATVESS